MARFRLTLAIHAGNQRYAAGEIVSDQPSLKSGLHPLIAPPPDRHWPNLSKDTIGPGMVPLDDEARAMKAASIYKNENINVTVTGVDSIKG